MTIDLPTQYDPKSVEAAIYQKWLAAKAFHATPETGPRESWKKHPFSIVIPPPNVTGALHLGHAINGTIQDVLIRYHRMRGDNSMWMPGIDHAGIATQAVVEKTIFEKEKKSRHDLGREELVRRIWEWKEQFGTRILSQLQSIGASCDWDRTRFTLDETCAKAVREAFFKMFKDGLIFRGKRLVNWDTHLQTAVADDEIYHEPVKGQLTYIRYPVCGYIKMKVSDFDFTEFLAVLKYGIRTEDGPGYPIDPFTASDVRNSIPNEELGSIPFSKLEERWKLKAQEGIEALKKWVRDYHMQRIAYLVRHGWSDPIVIKSETESFDGGHRVLAAIIRGDETIECTNTKCLIVATTRPETMLGDTAVAVHPDDPRYKHLIGKHVIIPLVGRRIPIIADGLLVDPKFGTGVVKVTPAHDPNDYATGQRHNLEQINLLTPDGKVNERGAGEFMGKKYSYTGLKFATAARKQVLADLEELGLIADKKVHEHEVGHSDRSKTPIEPYLSDQWFVRMGDLEEAQNAGITLADGTKKSGLAQAAIDAVKDGRVKITPERYAKGYVDWLSQKRDWCISRQLWWGHRIPVWRRGNLVFDVLEEAGPLQKWQRHDRIYWVLLGELQTSAFSDQDRPDNWNKAAICVRDPEGQDAAIVAWLEDHGFVRDPDVLDTWFSSALWPLSTMGWPHATPHPSVWSRTMWEGENYTEAAVRAYFQKHVFLPSLNNEEQKAAAAMQEFDCAYIGNRLHITFRNADLENAVRSTITTMGYTKNPSSTPEPELLPYFYPTSVLSTARDILTLWVARMVMFGLYCHGDVPFRQVFVHPVIQDGEGRIMSKSKGNGVDPVEIIASHGADALRFTLASMATETQDIRMPVVKDPKTGTNTSPKFDIGRNFSNKIWNAARYILTNMGDATASLSSQHSATGTPLEDRWILSRLNETIRTTENSINTFHFAEMATSLYQFFWTDLCDWYLEISKARIRAGDPSVQAILFHCLESMLKLLHPAMPFITEEIWSKLPARTSLLINAPWPAFDAKALDPAATSQMALIQSVTSAIREIQNRYPAAKGKGAVLQPRDATIRDLLEKSRTIIEALAGAKIDENSLTAAKPENAAATVLPELQIFIGGVIDKTAETAKLTKRKAELEKFIAAGKAKLANEAAVAKVPANIAQGWRDQLTKQEEEFSAIEKNLVELGG